MPKILVTGTAGFIGYHTALALASKGYEVVGLDAINDYYDVNLKYDRLKQHGIAKEQISYNKLVHGDKSISFIQLNLEDQERVMKLFKEQRFDCVINLAAQAGVRYSLTHPHVYTESNITGFLNILEGSRHAEVGHLVYASSSSVYGLDKDIPFSESVHTDHPISLYAATKKANEMMAHTYSHLYRIPTSGLRFFTVYGPWGRPDMALFLFTKAILANEPINIFNEGKMFRDFTYVDDIVEGVVRVMEKTPESNNPDFDPVKPDPAISSAPYRLYNIGNHTPVNLMDFIHLIEEKIGKKAIMNLMPMQPGDVAETYASVQHLDSQVGFKPNTSISTGIDRFIDWYRSYYGV